jgi:hypothetical protein
MVSESNTGDLPAAKATETGPAYLGLEFVQAKGARFQQRGSRTAGYIIARKCERIQQYWKTKDDTSSAEPGVELGMQFRRSGSVDAMKEGDAICLRSAKLIVRRHDKFVGWNTIDVISIAC